MLWLTYCVAKPYWERNVINGLNNLLITSFLVWIYENSSKKYRVLSLWYQNDISVFKF